MSKGLVLVLGLMSMVALAEGAPTDVELQRTALRTRSSFGFAATGGWVFQVPMLAVGAGVTMDGGLVVDDRFSFLVRAMLATIVVSTVIQVNFAFEAFLSEQASLGLGFGASVVGGFIHAPLALSLVLPVRFTWIFARRDDKAVKRTGFFGFAEAYGGMVAGQAGGRPTGFVGPPFAGGGTIGFGYGWW